MKKTVFYLLVLAVFCTGCKPDIESCFTFTVSGDAVVFNSGCSIEAETYHWDFGDGLSSSASDPIHTYTTSGTYTVILEVADKKGRVNTSSSTVSVVVCSPACVNGQCVSGTCDCDPGWMGPACDQHINAKFDGTYTLTETCTMTGADTYTITITPSSTNFLQATFNGLYREPFPVVADLDSTGTNFTIAPTNIGPGTLQSAGTCSANASGSSINVTYEFSNGTASEVCTATLTRQ
jgi:PKD repeat protein